MSLTEQYRTPSNLNARIQLHQRFSHNAYGWFRWVFDQLELPPSPRLLELGCGPGNLWLENIARLPESAELLLADLSPGMLAQARRNLNDDSTFHFQVIDAGKTPLPLESASLDALIANHMLYYVQDKPALFGEALRLLKPGAFFFASTVGEKHMQEINQLLQRFDPTSATWKIVTASFSLENAPDQLAPFFSRVELRRYPDALTITEPTPLVDYIRSGWPELTGEKLRAFEQFVAAEMQAQGGRFYVTKDSGLFLCTP